MVRPGRRYTGSAAARLARLGLRPVQAAGHRLPARGTPEEASGTP